jgi:TRAP-type mannitol/chloroaromatic compound transport system permease small subunit
MQILLKIARAIDRLNEACGRLFMGLVLAAVLISAGNAIVRKLLNTSSNAFLEIQWYLFGAIFLLCAGYALKTNAHVRIDVIYGRLSQRAQAWIDIVGTLLFLLPLCAVLIYFGWPRFIDTWLSWERSSDAGGLVRWPVWLLMPLGFTLLALQGCAELIKRVAFLRGLIPYPKEKEFTGESELIEDIKAQRGPSE